MNRESEKEKVFDILAQFAIPCLTISAQLATSLKYPQFGLIINLVAQPFWIYSTWIAYKKAGQIGTLISVLIYTVVTALGVINYWLLK